MAGYPYNNDIVDDDKVYISDIILFNSKYFFYGFMLGIITTPGVCLADEIANIPSPAPSPNVPAGNVPTNTRNVLQNLIAVSGCGLAVEKCSVVGTQAVKAATDKLSTVSQPSLVAVGGCLVLIGFCAGKLTTKGVDRILGFK